MLSHIEVCINLFPVFMQTADQAVVNLR
jgi:hypothetical protein